MKITGKILQQRVRGKLSRAKHVDISNLGVGKVEGLQLCPNIESLDLGNNCLEEFDNFENCKNLWRINLSNNQISNLRNLSQLTAIGVLDLTNNLITWKELLRLRHIHILDLRLYGNKDIENDLYYRFHVIDCLPLVWMVDGKLVTCAERLQVQQFFQISALSSRPVRHKFNGQSYFCLKGNQLAHIHGTRTAQFMRNFSCNETHNSETDKRRLEFLADNLEADINLKNSSVHPPPPTLTPHAIKHLINGRHDDKERSNMFLLLLISSLEFQLPEVVIKQTLEVAKLTPLFNVETFQFFELDVTMRIEVICLLVSSCKLDRDMKGPTSSNFTAGGLYDRLYLCLYHSVSRLIKRMGKDTRKSCNLSLSNWRKLERKQKQHPRRPFTAPSTTSAMKYDVTQRKSSSEWTSHRSLLASELVLLLSVVPSFYHMIAQCNRSICEVVGIATGDHTLAPKLAQLTRELVFSRGDVTKLYKEICKCVINKIEVAAVNSSKVKDSVTGSDVAMETLDPGRLSSNSEEAQHILGASSAYPKRPKSAILTSGELLMRGRSRPVVPFEKSICGFQHRVELGSKILLGPQNIAKVIALPDPDTALVQMDVVPAPNGCVTVCTRHPEEHYCYVDITRLEYDSSISIWKPRGTVGDRITLETDFSDVSLSEGVSQIVPPQRSKFESIEYRRDNDDGLKVLAGTESDRSNFSKKHPALSPRSSVYPRVGSFIGNTKSSVKKDRSQHVHLSTPQPLVQKPLSALFCEKMDLALSEKAFQIEMNSGISPQWHKNDDNLSHPIFITDAPTQIDAEGSNDGYEGIETFHDPDYKSENALNESWIYPDRPPPNSIDGELENSIVSCYNAEVLEQPPGEDEKMFCDVEEEITNKSSSDHDKKISSHPVNIPMPSLDAASIDGSGVEEEVNLNKRDKSEERSNPPPPPIEKDEPTDLKNSKPILMVKNESYNLDVSKSHIQDEDVKPAWDLRRRVQSARIRKQHPTINLEISRPLSAVTCRQKQVMFQDVLHERDDSRPGSASSFQLQRTEAWRSSASSGTGGLMQDDPELELSRSFNEEEPANKLKAVKFQNELRSDLQLGPVTWNQVTNDRNSLNSKTRAIRQTSPQAPPTSPSRELNEVFRNHALYKTGNTQISIGSRSTRNWLAEGRDMHREDYEAKKLIISPRLPGYLDDIIPKSGRTNRIRPPLLNRPSDVTKKRNLPSRPIKSFSRLPTTSYRRGNDAGEEALSLGSDLVCNRPRFSLLQEVKRLSGKAVNEQSKNTRHARLIQRYR